MLGKEALLRLIIFEWQVSLGPMLFRAGGPKPLIGQGCLCIAFSPYKDLVVGGGDGTVNLIRLATLKLVKSIKLQGHITSLAIAEKSGKNSFDLYAGTSLANLYLIKYALSLSLSSLP